MNWKLFHIRKKWVIESLWCRPRRCAKSIGKAMFLLLSIRKKLIQFWSVQAGFYRVFSMEFTDLYVKIIPVLVKSLLPKVFDNNLYLSSQMSKYNFNGVLYSSIFWMSPFSCGAWINEFWVTQWYLEPHPWPLYTFYFYTSLCVLLTLKRQRKFSPLQCFK